MGGNYMHLGQHEESLVYLKKYFKQLEILGGSVEKPEALTTLCRNENYKVNFRITRHLPGQPESARSGQVVRFFQVCWITYK